MIFKCLLFCMALNGRDDIKLSHVLAGRIAPGMLSPASVCSVSYTVPEGTHESRRAALSPESEDVPLQHSHLALPKATVSHLPVRQACRVLNAPCVLNEPVLGKGRASEEMTERP